MSGVFPIGQIYFASGDKLVIFDALEWDWKHDIFYFVCGNTEFYNGICHCQWSLMAPVFIPAFLEYGFSADMVQCAFRVGDSVTNAITPFMYYMPLVLAYMRYYEDTSTYVTLFKYTWKYSFMIGVAWILLFLVWYFCDFPFGL